MERSVEFEINGQELLLTGNYFSGYSGNHVEPSESHEFNVTKVEIVMSDSARIEVTSIVQHILEIDEDTYDEICDKVGEELADEACEAQLARYEEDRYDR